jgi:uncharacterized protein YkwD
MFRSPLSQQGARSAVSFDHKDEWRLGADATMLRDAARQRALSRPTLVLFCTGIIVLGAAPATPAANADNKRLNNDVVINVETIKRQAGCPTDLKVNPQLQLAAQWHADDVLNDQTLDGDLGSDGSSVQDRARAAGYKGTVAETVAINPALAINNLDIMSNWYYRPDYLSIMSNCANTQIGVWSENGLSRSVAVAVYGQPG